ncbi:Cytochrome P450 18a1, partial [Stegodyphus mimosarum]
MSVTFEEDDEGFKRLLALFDEGFRLLTLAVPVNFIPSLRHMPGWNHSYAKIVRNKEETAAYFREIAEKHKETMDEETVRDFVDAFYLQQKKAEESNEPTFFSQEQLVQVMGDIFSAGVETVTSTLEWSILFLIRNPDVQARLREELDRVVGQNRPP